MEPDVVRLYSSSPPPLDEVGEEEDEDEFGDFGGYGGGMSSSFSEFDTPTAFGQLYAADTLPPDRHLKSLQAVSQAGKTPVVEETGKLAEKHQSSLGSNSKPSAYEPGVSVGRENGEPETSEVLVNGVSPYDLQGAHIALPNTARQGLYLSNRHSKLNRAPEEEEPRESRLNSTDTGPTGDHSTDTGPTGDHSTDAGPTGDHSTDAGPTGDHNTETKLAGDQSTQITLAVANGTEAVESRIDPQPPVSAGTFQREVPEPGDTAAGAQLAGVTSHLQPGTDSTAGPAAVPSTELPEEPEDEGRPAGPVADEDFGDFRAVDQGFADFSQTDSAMQEGFADFVTALSGCSSDEEFGDTDAVKDLREEEELAEEEEKEDEEEGPRCPELPQSDSFADFRSAPCSDLAGGAGESWAEFDLQGSCESQHESWAAFHEERQSSAATSPPSDSLQTNDVSGMLSCRLQHLFQSTFLSEVTPEVPEVATLRLLLEPQDHGDSLPVQGEPVALWHHLLDIHAAHGLKVQWVGSHSNRILLDSLGMRNILFTDSKHPVIVPIFAAGLGMLEPTKDPLKTSSAVRSSSSGQDTSTLCTPVVVSSRIGEDASGGAVSQLNLDFFGPAEEDSDADTDTDAPLPGVDPELYELTTAKLENSNTGSNRTDAFNRLMETIEKTSTLQRKPELDGEISEEAARVISVLPNLSFMKARVLMFPATLTPTANHL